jgi:hypothetical protein
LKNHANILTQLKKYIFSDEFLNASRISPKHFTRKRSLPFTTLILFLINFLKGSLQDELDWFFKHLHQTSVPEKIVSKSALCQARKKLKPDTFRRLNQQFVRQVYKHQKNLKFWKRHRLIAADGTSVLVPDTEEILEHFGYSKNSVGTVTPMAQVLGLYDPLNGYVIDSEIGPFKADERKQLYSLLDRLNPNDLLLLDRGFPSYWIFSAIVSHGINFTCRLPIGKWKVAKELVASGDEERIVVLTADPKNKKTCRTLNIPTNPLELRVIKVVLPNGRPEVLITSLTDSDLYPHKDFKELYHKRWWIEEDFKLLKSRTKVEHFTGVTPLTIYQDFHAKTFSKNVAALLRSSPDRTLERQGAKKKHHHQINRTQTVSRLKDIIISLFCVSRKKLEKILGDIDRLFLKITEPIRKNRQYQRKRKKKSGFAVQYKPTR